MQKHVTWICILPRLDISHLLRVWAEIASSNGFFTWPKGPKKSEPSLAHSFAWEILKSSLFWGREFRLENLNFYKEMNDRCPCVKKRASSCKSEQLVYAYADCGQSTRSPARRISRRPAHAIGLLKDACACEIFLETQGHFVELLKLFVTPFLSEVAFQAWHSAEHFLTKKLSRLENVPFRRVLLLLWSEWSLYALDLRSFPTIWRDFESQA